MTSYFAQDVFSYSLEYFHGDYQSVGATDHLMDKGTNNHYLNNFVSLYNGNIGAMITNLTKQDETVNLQAQVFRYDNLNRIRNSVAVSKLDYNLRAGDNTWVGSEIVGSVIGGSFQNGLATTYTYDPAGNISDLTRTDLTGNLFDNFHYNYETLTINGFSQDIGSKNRLFQVTDAVAPSVKTDDFDSQVNADNYVYDLLGRVVEDKAKNLVQTYNKENKIITQTIGSKVVTYKYDFQSKRVSKTVVNGGLSTTEYYVRDPQGNVLAIYADTLQNADRKFTLSELHIYGSSRLGTYKVDSVLWENGSTATSSNKYSFKLGQKRYELSNHLGNVSTTISDRKLVDVQTNGIITVYKADVQSVTDYYPFGKTISERAVSKNRYGFNSKETDQESGYQDYGFRDYDVEVCRFLQVDPLASSYPWNATYCFAENSPIWGIDLDGKELWIANNEYSKNDILSLVDDKSLISFIPDGNYLKVEINYGEQDKNQLKKNDRGLELLSDIIFNTKGKKILYEADELTIYKNNGKIEGYPSFQGNGIANYSNGGKDSNNESIYTPKEDFDGQVVIDPFFKHYETYTNPTNGLDEKRPKRKQVVFHELAENFERTVNLKDYKSKSGKIGAHELANDREKLWKYKSLAPGEIRQISNVDRDLKNPNRTPHTEIFEKLSNLNKK